MTRRGVLAGLIVVVLAALAVVIASNATDDGPDAMGGHPVLAGRGVKVSIASMQARERRIERRKGTGPITQVREKPDPAEQAAEGDHGEEEQPAEVERAAGEEASSAESSVGEKPEPGEPERLRTNRL